MCVCVCVYVCVCARARARMHACMRASVRMFVFAAHACVRVFARAHACVHISFVFVINQSKQYLNSANVRAKHFRFHA